MRELLIRVDGGSSIGSGHISRCLAIAKEAEKLGVLSRFLVSTDESYAMLPNRARASILGSNPFNLRGSDADRIVGFWQSGALLVDSYGVSFPFFQRLRDSGIRTCYIDDDYLFKTERHEILRWPVDVLVDYRFCVDRDRLRGVYAETGAEVLAGPEFAPVAERFVGVGRNPTSGVSNILVTTGSTNPAGSLERIVRACRKAFPSARVKATVGRFAHFDAGMYGFGQKRVKLLHGVSDLAPLMREADLVVSAAGTTLYELCAAGVPSFAVPIVENQLENARGFAEAGCGGALLDLNWAEKELVEGLRSIAGIEVRRSFCSRMRSVVPGDGARKIVEALLG